MLVYVPHWWDNCIYKLYPLTGAQLGATYVVDINGRVIMEHRMESLGDICDNGRILKSLGLSDTQKERLSAADGLRSTSLVSL